ncbi:paired immunoglobulin-like type 2 receptor alpha [Pygocentrus nattereri]|uniref:paired immunoglobulin-like type 2 receptor alpha n=1 Tax=Pygocentrus nattereri TaxID=42514 RepID=UPI000814517F|nr:paired immunoglobulin-like type 2 receptor alpha [Pygocentrus nattereri]
MEVMVWLCFTHLLWFLGQSHGQTQFIYRATNKVELRCETTKWQISTKSDSRIDFNCTQCDHISTELTEDDKKLDFCTNNHSESKPGCTLAVKSGFVACVKSLDPGFLYPFKPSPNIVRSYIVAVPNPHITSTPEETSSLTVPEGGSVSLNCSFTFTQEYNGVSFVVYWIKTVGESSTCVYSYDYNPYELLGLGHHCTIQEDLLNRLSNQTEGQNSHNIRISEVMESDSGQYLCAVQVHPSNKNTAEGNWKVIKSITVSVHKGKRPQPTRTTVTQTTTEKTTKKTTEETTKKATENGSDDDHLKPLYVALPIILCLLLIVLVVFIRKKCITSQGRQTGQQREEAPDMDCSPYAVGNGEEGSSFGSKTADPGREESTPPTDPHSVVRMNSLYESLASDHNKHI